MSHRTLVAAVGVFTLISLSAAVTVYAQDGVRIPIVAELLTPVASLTGVLGVGGVQADPALSLQEPSPVTAPSEVPAVVSVTVGADTQIVPVPLGLVSTPNQMTLPVPSRPNPGLMLGLYATTVVMQGLDAQSTFAGLKSGGVEANGTMGGITKSRVGFYAVKAAVATGTILAARHIAKRNKVAAIVMLVAVNSAYALVAVHNYKVAGRVR